MALVSKSSAIKAAGAEKQILAAAALLFSAALVRRSHCPWAAGRPCAYLCH